MDVCNKLATDSIIHNAIKILSKLSVSEATITVLYFPVFGKFGSTFVFTYREWHITALKRVKTYMRTTRAYKRG